MDLGQEWFEDQAVQRGIASSKESAKAFGETLMNYYDTEQWKREP